MCRKFYNPTPAIRSISDSTCNLIYAIKGSLRKGITRCNKLAVEFRHDVFKYLFGGKGKRIAGKRGMEYSEDDFCNEHFPTDWHKCYNRSKECCYVAFPVTMYVYVKFSPITYSMSGSDLVECKRDFKEVLHISLVKKRSMH